MGHEYAGTVAEVGEGVTEFAPGDKVIEEPVHDCGECFRCKNGQESVYQNSIINGMYVDGAYADSTGVEKEHLHAIPDDVPLEHAAIAKPTSIATLAVFTQSRVTPGFDASSWATATVVDAPGGALRPERIEPMRVVDSFDVEAVHDHQEGPILDFGQNLTGWVELTIDDPDAGDEVTIRHAEALTDEGDLSTIDLRSADAPAYVARGTDSETYEPRFTYHGFRYAQFTGYPGEFDPSDVTAKAVHTAMDRRGEFACSNEELNQLQHNSVWGLRGNTHSIPEDCPQRDERFGWTGDAHISTRSLLFNYEAVRFDEKWARDHDDVAWDMGYVPDVIPNKATEDPADPTWSITRVGVPWYLYRHDGDEGILREQYEGMREYVDVVTLPAASTDGPLADDFDRFRTLVDVTENREVTLTVETHWGTHTEDPTVAAEYAASVPGLEYTLDPGHYVVGDHSLDRAMVDLLDDVAHVHLRQAGSGWAEIQLPVDEGYLDVASFVESLRRSGYNRALTVEHIDSLDGVAPDAAERQADAFRTALEALV